MRSRLTAPAARAWYIGSASALLWQSILVATVILTPQPLLPKVLGLVLLAVLYVVYLALGPLITPEGTRVTLLAIGAYWLATFLLFPLIGVATIWVWLLIMPLAAFTGLPTRYGAIVSALVVAAQLVGSATVGFALESGTIFAPIVSAVLAATLLIVSLLSTSNENLRLAHDEIARLAVVEERARFGRDLHDVLGHSLTVVAVKSELARRLVRIDAEKAEAEIADIETLARRALADLRTAVSNYREIDLDAELIAASTALAAAGIDAHLPESTSLADPKLQAVFAWVLREAVTNVIRHSSASSCWVTIARDRLTVADDGRGPDDAGTVALLGDGNGLRGLRERTAEVGAVLDIGRSSYGGFELTVRSAG
jgi:two-component system sensor histidine kinase DesK